MAQRCQSELSNKGPLNRSVGERYWVTRRSEISSKLHQATAGDQAEGYSRLLKLYDALISSYAS